MIILHVDFVSQLNHNTDNPLWIFLLVQFHFTTGHIVQVVKFKNYLVITYNKTTKSNKWNKTYNLTIPNTGDSMNVGLSLVVLLVSSCVILTTLRKIK